MFGKIINNKCVKLAYRFAKYGQEIKTKRGGKKPQKTFGKTMV